VFALVISTPVSLVLPSSRRVLSTTLTAGAPSAGVASGPAADDVDDADTVESVLESVLVGEAVMVESVAVEVALAVGVAEALTLSVVELASDVAVAEAELSVADAETESVAVEDAETESVAVDVGTAPSDARVVVAEMETRVLTEEEAEAELSGLLALKARASSGVSRTVIFSTTVVVSLMLVAGSRFSWRSYRARRG
jgi:hypothetical protein